MCYYNRTQEINEKILLLVVENFGYINGNDEIGLIQYIELSEKIKSIKLSNVTRRDQIENFIIAYEMIIELLEDIKNRCHVSVRELKYNLGFESFEESLERLAPLDVV